MQLPDTIVLLQCMQGMYLSLKTTSAWMPGERRTFFFRTYFSQGVGSTSRVGFCWHIGCHAAQCALGGGDGGGFGSPQNAPLG